MRTVVGAAIGECVHVAGVINFLRIAKGVGWKTIFLGPAVPIEKVIEIAKKENADLVGVSYRLTPENGERLLAEFAEAADELRSSGIKFVFGGTPPVVERVKRLGFFDACFDGSESSDELLKFLKNGHKEKDAVDEYPQKTVKRIEWKAPYPLIRHHFGLPNLDETIVGIEKISDAKVLDVISLGIDQDAQENFFHPENQNPRKRGAGGVPVRSADDYRRLFNASRRGNYPLLRTYTGTNDLLRLAEVYVETINIAWAAIPLFWFNKMDGRGPLSLVESVRKHQELMAWYGKKGIPVEVNEPHHWGMRDAPDVVFVATAYLSAYNAKIFGVRDYITSLMFNSPPGLSDSMDLAKMLAVLEMIQDLETSTFRIWRQTRTGLLSYPLDVDYARAHLSASVYLQMALKPHILHVVGYTEADHAVNADEVIESCKIAKRSAQNALSGQPSMIYDPVVQNRKEELIKDAKILLNAIKAMAPNNIDDPWTDAENLANSIKIGLLDAPQLINNPYAPGKINTIIDDRGACVVVDSRNNKPIRESERVDRILNKIAIMA